MQSSTKSLYIDFLKEQAKKCQADSSIEEYSNEILRVFERQEAQLFLQLKSSKKPWNSPETLPPIENKRLLKLTKNK